MTVRKTGLALLYTLVGSLALGHASISAATLEQIKERGEIRIAVANEIPYGYVDLSGEAKGAGPDVARHLAKALGINRIKWETASFSALIPGLKAGRFDMVAAEMAILPQRCQEVLFSEPNSSYGEGLLVPAGNPRQLNDFSQFSQPDLKVAIMAGADQLEMLQALNVPEANRITIANNADAISTVATGRADAYAATSLTVNELASKSQKVESASGFIDPVIDGKPVRSWGGFTFAKGSESLQQHINTALTDFRKTPQWRKILEQYGFSEADIEQSGTQSTAQLCARAAQTP
ncbi:MAG: ectoine/hydroxyectoine ABC transporter substrate-binding protein EhuB [Pusillimonas sp.]